MRSKKDETGKLWRRAGGKSAPLGQSVAQPSQTGPGESQLWLCNQLPAHVIPHVLVAREGVVFEIGFFDICFARAAGHKQLSKTNGRATPGHDPREKAGTCGVGMGSGAMFGKNSSAES